MAMLTDTIGLNGATIGCLDCAVEDHKLQLIHLWLISGGIGVYWILI